MSDPQKEQRIPVNQEKAAFGRAVLQRLGHDVHVGRGEPPTLASVLDTYGRNEDGVFDPEQAAQKLYDSLNALIPDKGEQVTGKDGKKSWKVIDDPSNEMDKQALEDLQALFKNSGAKTPEELAKYLSQHNLQIDSKDPSKKEPLMTYLYRMGDGGINNFAMEFTGAQIGQFREFLNMFHPGLGDVFMEMLGGMGLFQETTPEAVAARELENQFELGYMAMNTNASTNLAKLWGNPITDANGEFIQYNAKDYQGPLTHGTADAFFSDGGIPNSLGGYSFTNGGVGPDSAPGKADFSEVSFEHMILGAWEKNGIVEFDNAAARENFIAAAKQFALGAQPGAGFIECLGAETQANPGGLNLIEFSDPGAKAALANFLQNDLNMHDPQAAAKALIEFIDNTPGVEFSQGFNYQYALNTISAELADFEKSATPREFAQRLSEYAQQPGSGVNLNMAATADPATAPPSAIVPGSDSLGSNDTSSHEVSTYAQHSTGDGKPSVVNGATGSYMEVNGNRVSGSDGQFEVYADGRNAQKVGLNADVSQELNVNRNLSYDAAV